MGRRTLTIAALLCLLPALGWAQIDYRGPSTAAPYALNAPIFWDDFIGGKGNTTGDLGSLGWAVYGTGGSAQVAGRPGVATLTAAATGFAGTHLYNGFNIPLSTIGSVTFIASWPTGANLPDCRFGLVSTNVAAEPADDAVYFEKLAADTNWFAVTRDGATTNHTRTDTGVAWGAGEYPTLKITHPATGKWEFFINGALVASRTTGNIPAEATFSTVNLQIETNGTALAVSADWALIELKTSR